LFVVSPDSAAAAILKDYINNYSCPSLSKDAEIYLNNGADDASVLSSLKDQFVSHNGTEVITTPSERLVHGKLVKLSQVSNGLTSGNKGGALAPPPTT
jgi:hypothetical protein